MTTPFIPYEADGVLDWIELTDAIAEGHARPKAEVGDTFLYRDPDMMLSRSAWVDGLGVAVKTATVFPGNLEAGKPTIGGIVSIFSDADGTLSCQLDFRLVTKWKTAGDSLLAARRLARPDSKKILIVGAGTVAASLIEAYGAAFPDAAITLWNRTRARAEELAKDYAGVDVADELADAVQAADIISCATMSKSPVIRGEWLRPGQHVDLIGAFDASRREADDTAITRARLFVDSYDTTLDHIGELKTPLAEGTITRDDVLADYYDLAAFTRAPEDITLFKNGGGAHLDLMTSKYIQEKWDNR